jgi:hypothetical protein
MKSGIFNPFAPKTAPPKRKMTPSLERGVSLAEEAGEGEYKGSSIRLDGGSYILELNEIELEDVPDRLGNLVKEIIEHHPDHMFQQGVQLIPRGKTFQVDDEEMVLPTPVGHLLVYVGSVMEEDTAYRRIAHALRHLPIESILAKHKARIIVRS